jgi:aspartate kinase
MRIFKFGGASVKDAGSVRNLAHIVKQYLDEPLIVVVSAMGKTTNLLERICQETYKKQVLDIKGLEELRNQHLKIAYELIPRKAEITVDTILDELKGTMEGNWHGSYDFYYDQVVSFGEVLSTRIIQAYLAEEKVACSWHAAKTLIQTDQNHRNASVQWDRTVEACETLSVPKGEIFLTQGFIGATTEGYTTTLGREGSDYSAAILAYVFNAREVVIWKDVPGMMNADPAVYKKAQKLDQLSFREAIELSYFGAKIIHPKTLQPLKKKNIPLRVKSFIQPEKEGTLIQTFTDKEISLPSFAFKSQQVLITFRTLDFSFMIEENLSGVFAALFSHKVKVNLIQNSAINLSICVDDDPSKLGALIKELRTNYRIKYNRGVRLLTLLNRNKTLVSELLEKEEILLEQSTRDTARYVIRTLNFKENEHSY